MSSKIFKINDIDFGKIFFMKPTSNKNDIVIPIYVQEEKKIPLFIQVPPLFINDSYNGKGYIILPLVGKSEQTTKNICSFFTKLDETIINNLKKILYEIKNEGKYKHIDFSNISYRAIVNEVENDSNEIYNNGLVKYKLYGADNFKTQVFDNNKQLLNENEYIDKLSRGSYIKSIIEIHSLVLHNNNVYVHIKPHQLQIINDQIEKFVLTEYSFVDSDSESNDVYKCDEMLFTQTECQNDINTNIDSKNNNDNKNEDVYLNESSDKDVVDSIVHSEIYDTHEN